MLTWSYWEHGDLYLPFFLSKIFWRFLLQDYTPTIHSVKEMVFCKERYQYTRDVWFLVLNAIFSYIIAVNLIGGEKPQICRKINYNEYKTA